MKNVFMKGVFLLTATCGVTLAVQSGPHLVSTRETATEDGFYVIGDKGTAAKTLFAAAVAGQTPQGGRAGPIETGGRALERTVQLVGAELSNQITIEEHVVSADNTPFLGKGLEGVAAWRIEFAKVSLTGRLPVARPGEADQYAGQRKVTVLIDRKTGQLLSVRSRFKAGLDSSLPPEPSWESATSDLKHSGEVYEGFPNLDPKVTLLQAFNTEMSKGVASPFWTKEWDAFYVIHSGAHPSAQPVWIIVHKGVPPMALEVRSRRILTLTQTQPGEPPKILRVDPGADAIESRTYLRRVVLDAASGEIISAANQ